MTLWMVRTSKGGEHQDQQLDEGFVCIGFKPTGDLRPYDTRAKMREYVSKTYSGATKAKVSNVVGQLFAMAHRIQDGDLVAMPLRKRSQVAIGRVKGPYLFEEKAPEMPHTRLVEWLATDVPRTAFGEDLLASLGSIMTVCEIKRNDAEERVKAIAETGKDPGAVAIDDDDDHEVEKPEQEASTDVEQLARDQILAYIRQNFRGHEFARLVDAVLQSEGYVTHLSPPGPDGGVDILAGKGTLGFDGPKLCVQVKATERSADVTVLRGLQGSMATFKANEGLLVCWGGFNAAVLKEARLSFFSVRLWDAENVVEALFRNYERLSDELQAELPLKRVWALVVEE